MIPSHKRIDSCPAQSTLGQILTNHFMERIERIFLAEMVEEVLDWQLDTIRDMTTGVGWFFEEN